MNATETIKLLVFLAVMLAATVVPAVLIMIGVMTMRFWMSRRRRIGAGEAAGTGDDGVDQSHSTIL